MDCEISGRYPRLSVNRILISPTRHKKCTHTENLHSEALSRNPYLRVGENLAKSLSRIQRIQSGYMLIETLISIGILALGLLGVSMMQITALDSSVSAVQRSEITILLASMSERMRANPQAVYAGKYNGLTRTEPETTKISQAAQRAQIDFNRWLIQIDHTIGKGASPVGKIHCPTPTNCILQLSWNAGLSQAGESQPGPQTRYKYANSVVF
jgi:type IV pilus assembly protein PilV